MSPHHVAYATERARTLFGSYRRGDANDPDIYVSAIAAVLSIYSADLIREVTDPRTGIMTTEKYMSFMPNAGELKVYCEGIATRRERLERLGARAVPVKPHGYLPPREPKPGDLANLFVPAANPRYAKLAEWSKTADPRMFRFEQRPGIWIAHSIWEVGPAPVARPMSEFTRSVVLSQQAQKAMREVDAERYGDLPVDQHAHEAAE